MIEIYKDITGYEGFHQVSNLGNVRSLDRINSSGYNLKGKAMKPRLDTYGYYLVNLSKNGKVKTFSVHQLIAIAFLNHTPNGHKGLIVDHMNGDRSDNRLDNLQLITQRENCSKDRKGYSSKYTGVGWHKAASKWVARIRINGKNKQLGCFTDELEASKAYNEALNNLKTNKL